MEACRRVIKIGGSCLSRASFPDRFREWLNNAPPAENWIIVGGGECIDAMRDLAERFPLDSSAMHWRCVRLLRATYEILGELFPEWDAIDSSHQFTARRVNMPHVSTLRVAVDTFYFPPTDASAIAPLPLGWETTTDSIAAYLAKEVSASELVLIKSCLTNSSDVFRLAEEGVVDEAFPHVLPPHLHWRIATLS